MSNQTTRRELKAALAAAELLLKSELAMTTEHILNSHGWKTVNGRATYLGREATLSQAGR